MNRTLLILSGALVVAGVALFLVYADTYVEEETGGARVMIVTAALDIPFGQPLQQAWLVLEELPQAYVEDRHIRAVDMRGLIGVPLAQSVRAGEAILRTDLSAISDQQRTLSTEVPPGSRALLIVAQEESSHAGLLRPGDRVDVMLLVGDERIPGSGRATLISQNLLVLSVGQEIHRQLDSSRNVPRAYMTTQLTLEVDVEQAQVLTLARRQGRLRVLLRNPADVSEPAEPPVVRETDLLDPVHRQAWLRRFALVQAPAPPTEEAPPE